ncbi:hypothetical protein Tco_0097822 [Tanacetum coccineum]
MFIPSLGQSRIGKLEAKACGWGEFHKAMARSVGWNSFYESRLFSPTLKSLAMMNWHDNWFINLDYRRLDVFGTSVRKSCPLSPRFQLLQHRRWSFEVHHMKPPLLVRDAFISPSFLTHPELDELELGKLGVEPGVFGFDPGYSYSHGFGFGSNDFDCWLGCCVAWEENREQLARRILGYCHDKCCHCGLLELEIVCLSEKGRLLTLSFNSAYHRELLQEVEDVCTTLETMACFGCSYDFGLAFDDA